MSVRTREVKGRRLRAAGCVHTPELAVTRVVQGDTGGPYLTTAIYCGPTGWTGRCDCQDGRKWVLRGERPKLHAGQGCAHLREVYAEAVQLLKAQPGTAGIRRRLQAVIPQGSDR